MAIGLNKWCMIPLFFTGFFINGKEVNNSTVFTENEIHPVHISTVEINHNAADKTLEITCKIFWDDFEDILTKINKSRIDLTNNKNIAVNNKSVYEYIKTNLRLVVDGKAVPLSFVGYEKEDIVVYSYLQVDNITSLKMIQVTNTIMHDMFDDQTEIIHVIVNGKRKSTKLDYPASEVTFQF